MNKEKQILFEDYVGVVYDDGTYWCSHWSKDFISHWMLDESGWLLYKHRDHSDFVRCSAYDPLIEARWNIRIVSSLIEREIWQ